MSKIATKPATLTAIQSYDEYSRSLLENNISLRGERAYRLTFGKIYNEDGSLYISYKIYKKILSLYFIKCGIKLIGGYSINLLSGLGALYLMRQGRNPSAKPRLNRGESFKLKRQMEEDKEEITKDNWKVYYTDDEFMRTNWHKPSFVKNLIFYKFCPAGGQPGKGFKQTMSRTISSNPSLLALYPFVLYKEKTK